MDRSSIQSDLSYVRGAVDKSGKLHSPRAIYWMWALIVAVGFPLADLAPGYVGLYWMVMGPLGGILSGIMGYMYDRRVGQLDRAHGIKQGLHWGTMMVTIFATIILGMTGAIEWNQLHRVILLILALGYLLAGVHFERPLAWVGLVMFGGYFVTMLVHAYVWTIVGALVAIALVIAGFSGGRRAAA